MADLGAFSPRQFFRISSDIRLSRVDSWMTNLGTFRTEPSRGYRFAALPQYPVGRMAVWGIDLADGTIEEKGPGGNTTPSSNTGFRGYPGLRYEVALGPSLSLDVESKPSMWIIFWGPTEALKAWQWDVYRDEAVRVSTGPFFEWEPAFGQSWQPSVESSVCFFAAGSRGDGPNQREVLIMRGFWRGTSPTNYRGFQLHAWNPQTDSWRDLGGPPPPTWGINKEQEPVQAVPANGDIQMIWQTNSTAGIVSPGSFRPRIEEVGAQTSPSDGFGTAIQIINDDPAVDGPLTMGRPIGAYDISESTPPTLKIVTVELEAQVIHVYKTTPHISSGTPEWTEQTVVQPEIGTIRFANLALTGDRAGMVGEESGRQWLYCDEFDGDTTNIWRASYNVIQNRWDGWEFVCNTADAVRQPGEALEYENFQVLAGDDHILLLFEFIDHNEDLPQGPDSARRIFGLFDPAEGGPSTGGYSGPGRPTIVVSGGGNSASWVA